jgi:hypothetical protein
VNLKIHVYTMHIIFFGFRLLYVIVQTVYMYTLFKEFFILSCLVYIHVIKVWFVWGTYRVRSFSVHAVCIPWFLHTVLESSFLWLLNYRRVIYFIDLLKVVLSIYSWLFSCVSLLTNWKITAISACTCTCITVVYRVCMGIYF